ncbi:MAG: hypothetical protein J7623_11990 [Chitinophaga sp.]|uniref:tail fiber domain-containing protein n=1 Tax=Chitinophaga sp. TaxID=1869181 RepID=UPI001B29BE05|nr:tail fiber domain-containing protein [Chitinophaga sp.]MBO9729349.1 hypothetical protein [Chitinophaga sp.]
MIKTLILTLAGLLASLFSIGQQVYQIRADSVRIYNVCDTAELILENRTQGVSGFLYNKGRGRTEFRKIRLEKIGNSQIAISGQDTLDLGTLPGLSGVDTIYRSGDNIVYRKYGQLYNIAVPTGTSSNYIQNQSAGPQANSAFWINNAGIMRSLKTASNIGDGHWDLYSGTTPANTNIRWTMLLTKAEGGSNTGADFSIQRYADNNGGAMSIPLLINRNTGIVNLNNGLRAANSSGITGSGAAGSNYSWLGFYDNNNTNRSGYVGKGSATTTDIHLTSDSGNVILIPKGIGVIGQLIVSPIVANYTGGQISLGNTTSNNIFFGKNGVNPPTFTSRSIGTKIVLFDSLSSTSTDYAIGVENNHIWQAIPAANAVTGFKWYAGTTLLSRLDGTGVQEWTNMGRFKGYNAGGTGMAAEAYFGGGMAYFNGFDRTNNIYTPVALQGGNTGTGRVFIIDGTGYKFPMLAGAGILGTDASGYLTDKSAAFAPATGATGYIQNQVTAMQPAGNFWISGAGVANTLAGLNSTVAATPGSQSIRLYNGDFTTGKLRWSIGLMNTETGSNLTGSDLILFRYTDAGALQGTAMIMNRNTGLITMPYGFRTGNASGVTGTGAGNSNSSWFGFFENNGSTRSGYVGKGSTLNPDIHLVSDSGNVVLIPKGVASTGTLILSPTSLNYSGGQILLNEPTGNNIAFSNGGVNPPSFTTRSSGAKIVLYGGMNSASTDFAMGIELNHIWQAVPTSITGLGFKWYGGTTQIARLGATGNQEWAGAGRFQGAPSPTSDGTGSAIELGYVSGTGVVQSINKTGNLYMPTRIIGGSGAASPAFKTFLVDNAGYRIDLPNAGILGTDASGYLVDKAANFAAVTHTHTLTLTGAVTGTGTITGSIATTLAAVDAAKITTGTIAPARLGTGTASNTTFLRGDGTWQTVSTTTPTLQSVTTAGATTNVAISSTNIITSTGFYQSSLRSLKQNINDYTGNATDIINHFKIREFEYKNNPGKKVVGIIADDEAEIISGKNHDRFDMMNAMGLLLKSVQELHQQNEKIKQTSDQLQTENDQLKKQLQSLMERMEKLEKQSSK